jgi:hypothetical protein
VEQTAVHGPAERSAAAAAPKAQAKVARLDRMASPADVLSLQRSIGNRALARMAKSQHQMLHRACCPSCAAGMPCGDELLDDAQRH